MYFVRPLSPHDARRFLTASLRRLDTLTLESFTPAWSRPGTGR